MAFSFTARKHIGPLNDGSSVDAPNITDIDSATTDILFCRGAGGAQDDDWFILDCGAPSSIGQVQLANVIFSGSNQGVNCWVTNTATAMPGDANTAQMGANWMAGAGTAFPAISITGSALTGRYVLILSQGASGQSMSVGAITVSRPVIPVPSLTATPGLPGNVPSIILQGF